MLSAGLAALAWALLAPLAILALAPLLDGVARRIRARLESRTGPPWLQGYVDLAKLAGKHEVSSGTGRLAAVAPVAALVAAVAAGTLLPLAGHAPLGFAGDALAFLYLLGLSSVALVLAGAATGSPFAFLGGSREMMLLLLVEPVVACALFVAALKCGTFRLDGMVAWQSSHGPGVSGVLAALGVMLALLAYMGRLPFDLAEAEQELMGGSQVEFGGPRLALMRWAMFVRWLVVAWLVAEVFVPIPAPGVAGLGLAVLEVALLFALASAASALVARLRIDHVRAWFVQVGLLMGFSLAFALIGA
jgi:formate hydrogenlyase subunit 4